MSSSCQHTLENLVKCLQDSDCMQKEGKDIHICAKKVEACAGLRTAYFQCKRGQIDARNRITGNRYQ
ncbi:hypothetical protein WJX81_007114 [Elliptochloris bilobata]|uniref:Cytochrome c oxidase assembly factor 5 n=1 Tax=Elliptochloris bilobata TaxID=381761 RepID=A0AAW1SL17_9CHLO